MVDTNTPTISRDMTGVEIQVLNAIKCASYYLPKNNEERREGLAPYNRQIETEQKNVAMIMGVDLEKYWKGVENGTA